MWRQITATKIRIVWLYRRVVHHSRRRHSDRRQTASLECSTNEMRLEENYLIDFKYHLKGLDDKIYWDLLQDLKQFLRFNKQWKHIHCTQPPTAAVMPRKGQSTPKAASQSGSGVGPGPWYFPILNLSFVLSNSETARGHCYRLGDDLHFNHII